ncbi:MAG: hypothetical protein AAGN35_05360 [Bacteroidota bacterium]
MLRLRFLNLTAATLIALLFLAGCSSRTVVFVGEAEPDDFSLSFQMPQEFDFTIAEEEGGQHDFALELTYFAEQMQDWEEVPLYYILTRPQGEEDRRFRFKVRDKGEWRGELLANEHDRVFEQDFANGIDLAPGKYNFKLYGDNQNEGKPILGIVKVTFKVYRAD